MSIGRNVVRLSVLGAILAAMLLAVGMAQDDRGGDRDRDRDGPAPRVVQPPDGGDVQRPRGPERFQGTPRERRRGEGEEATEEGIAPKLTPQLVPPRIAGARWRLGVFAVNTDTGVRITQVVPNLAAWQAGLEARDVLVTVAGYQIGYVNGRLYDLASELQRRADPAGRVMLLVQNHRNNELVPMEVQLERVAWPQPFRQR